MGGRLSVSKSRSHVFQCLVNGMGAAVLSCQFGTMCTEPAAPHSLQTRREPIVDQGRSWGRMSNRTSTHAPIALATRTLDVAGHVTVGDPFRRAAWWVFVCPLFSLRSHRG